MRYAVPIVAILVLLVSAWPARLHAESSVDPVELEIVLWQVTEDEKDPRGYDLYLRKFPNGTFRELAVNRLAVLRPDMPPPPIGDIVPFSPAMMDEKLLLRWEIAFWYSIKDSTDVRDFDAYLRKFPAGTFQDLARYRRAKLQP
jgi:hypothetical protein